MLDIGATGLGLIDYAIFFAALVAVLVVGVVSGGKIKDLEDYATSRKQKFSTPVLAMTLIVTMIGSNSSMGSIAELYRDGIIYFLADLICISGPFLLILYAAKFMAGRYSNAISLYGIVEQEYGKWPAQFSAIISAFIMLISLAMQMIGMGYIVKAFLGLPFSIGLIGASVVLISYSSMGGVRGVVYTDVMQFFIILVVFPILVGIIVYNMGGLKMVFTNLPPEKTMVFSHPDFKEYTYLILFWMMPFGLLRATVIQRFLMCKDAKEVQKMGLNWVMFESVFIGMIGIIGLASISLLPSALSGKEVIPALMKEFLPIGFKGVAITAFMAVIMSTADSALNAATVLIAEIRMSKTKREELESKEFKMEMEGSLDKIKQKEKQRQEVLNLKISSFTLGCIAMAIALLDFSFIRAITISSAIAFAAVNIPIFFAPFKDKKQKAIKAYLGSTIGGFGSFLVLWLILGQGKMYMVSFYATFFAIAGWFIGANFFDKIKTNFWARMWEAYAPKGRPSSSELIKTTQGG
jgi:SSS family solute:Na+ symporter